MACGRLIARAAKAEAQFILRSVDGQPRPRGKSAVLAAKALARLLLYFPTTLRLARALCQDVPCCLLDRNPGVVLKHLRKGYARQLTAKERAAIVSHHYRQLSRCLGPKFLDDLLRDGARIWAASDDPMGPRIIAKSTDHYDFESELTLIFMLGSEVLYIMGGIFSPGEIWGAEDESVLVITRVQGIRLAVDKMKIATELCGDCAPRLLLFSAMEGLVAGMQVRGMIGVGVTRQIATEFETITTPSFFDNYDGLWQSLNAQPRPDGSYLLPTPAVQRPLSAIPSKHRGRAQARRTYRHIVTSAVASYFV